MYRLGHTSTVLFLVSCCVGFTGCESKKPAPEESPAKTSSAVETNSPTTQPAAAPTKESKPAVGNDPASETKTVPSVAKTDSSAPSGAPVESSKPDAAQNGSASSQPAPAALQKPEANLSPEQLAAWAWPEFEPLVLLAAKESDQLGLVTCAARTLDGKAYILAGSKLTLWSVKGTEPEKILHQTEGNENYLRSIAVSADGKWLAAGDSQGTVKIWWLDDHTERVSKKLGDQDIVDLAFSPDSKSIATISFDNEVSIWSTENLESKSKIKVSTNSVARMGFVDNERVIVFGETTSVWKIADGKQDKDLSGDRYNRVVGYTNDRQSIILGGETELRRWKITDDQPVCLVRGAFADNEMVVFSPDEKNLATANGNTIRIWDVAGQHCVQVIDVVGSTVVGLQWLPGSNLLVAVPDSGAVRMWGTRKSGDTAGLSPVHTPLTTSFTDKTPADAKQVADAVDFRSFPMLPGSTLVMANSSTLAYEAPVKIEEAKLFYRHHLGQRGWQESSGPSPNPMGIEFRKDGFMISASFYESSPTATSVNLNHGGNFDLRWLPRFDAAPIEESYASEHSVSYRTKSDILTIETILLRKLHEAGFTGYSRLLASQSEAEDARNLDFVNHCVDLRVTVQKFPATPDSYTISYSRFPTDHALPIPDDSGYVEFDGSTQPYLVANTSRSLAEMTQFYDSEMAKQGWLPARGRSTKDEACWLPYYQGQKDVLIGLVKLENGKTRIQVGEGLENSSWQLQKPADKDAAQSATGESSSAPGLEAADFPILPGAQDLKIDPQLKTLEFRVEGTPLAELAKLYTESMAKLGWVAETGGVRSDEYTYFNFEKDDLEISFRATQRQGNAQVSIEGDGLLWNKASPGGKRVVSFQSWLRENKLPAGLDLLDRYSTEMKAISGNK